MPSFEGPVEQQDSRGWTPIMWSASNGYSQIVKQLVQRKANVNHMGQAKGGHGTTMALHECASMRGEGGQAQEAYFETAWLLMSAGASPFAERSDGKIPLEVAAMLGNLKMKIFLETCSLFRGTLALTIPQTFGSKVKNRYCTVQPRFPFGNAAPTLWMVCYRNSNESQPVCRIPLSNARVMVEGPQDSSNGIIIIPGSGKSLKGVAVKSHTSNSFIIEIKAIGTPAMPGWKTLRTLADVCKAAAVAVSCRNLDQLCSAALRQATRQMHVPGVPAGTPNPMDDPAPRTGAPAQDSARQPLPPIKDVKQEAEAPQKSAGPMTDSAKDFTAEDMLPPPPSMSSVTSQGLMGSAQEPDTPRSAAGSELPRRTSGLGKLFANTFRRSSVAQRQQRYNSGVLDSNQSLGTMSMASTNDKSQRKAGLWKGLKRSMSGKPSFTPSPSIAEQSGSGLTAEDIGALSQPIPDKFWSKIGRKMSSQRPSRAPVLSERPQANWFHEDEGGAAAVANLNAPGPRRSFTHEDLNELMYPGQAPQEAGPREGSRPLNLRRQTSDNASARANANGTVAFILEEPIVPTQEMVPTGPRRSFSFDDYEDLVTGANRKARGHRENFVDQMAPTAAGPNSRHREPLIPHTRSSPISRPLDSRPQGAGAGQQGRAPQGIHRQLSGPSSVGGQPGTAMPRRSFSLQNMDGLLRPVAPVKRPAPQESASVQDDLKAWRESHGAQQAAAGGAAGVAKKRGPAIDPYSHGGYQGAPAPEWRPYRPPSAPAPAPAAFTQGRQAQPLQVRSLSGRTIAQPQHYVQHPQQQQQQQHQYHHASAQQHPAAQVQQAHANPQQAQPRQAQLQQLHSAPHPHAQVVYSHRPPVARQQSVDSSARQPVVVAHRRSHGKSTDEVIPPELAHLASLRALETENISSAASGKGDDRLSSSEMLSQDLTGHDVYTSAHGPEKMGIPAAIETGGSQGHPRDGSTDSTPASKAPPPQTPEKQPTIRVSPAVPAVLFQGARAPKIATPPQRSPRELPTEVSGPESEQPVA